MLGPFVFKWNCGWSDGVGMRDVGETLRDIRVDSRACGS